MKKIFKAGDFGILKEALDAERRIRKYIRETPVEYSPHLSNLGESRVHLKLENLQVTGSFKLRGAMNKILSLSEQEKDKGFTTASSGNHAAAVAFALNKFGIKGIIYLPENTSWNKVEVLRDQGAELEFYETDCAKTEIYARSIADKKKMIFIPPYNDIKIVGGQATLGCEILRQVDNIDIVLVPVGGGGLISGIAGVIKSIDKNIRIIGCQPENSAVMYESIKAGKIVEMESLPTLSDGTAGGIEEGSITFDICRKYVDDFIIVTEEEIIEALKLMLERHYMLVEGSAVLPVAAYLKFMEEFKSKTVVLIISGSKISLEQLKQIAT